MDSREKSPGLSFSSKEEITNGGDVATAKEFRWENFNTGQR